MSEQTHDPYFDSLINYGDPVMQRTDEMRSRFGVAPWHFTIDGEGRNTPAPCLIKGLVPADGICFLAGQSGAGKTFIEVHMSVCLAAGKSFFGHNAKERCGSVILAAEGAGGLQSRIDVAKRAMEITEALPIAWRAVDENLLRPDVLAKTIASLEALNTRFRDEFGVRLGAIFVDTIGAAFGLEDENDAAKVNAAMRALRTIGSQVGAVVIPVHHYGKAASTGLRGSSAFRGAADAILSVLADRDEITGESSRRSLCLAKSRDGEEGAVAPFELSFIALGVDEDGDSFGSCAVYAGDPGQKPSKKDSGARLTKGARIALAALQEAIGECGEIPPASNHIPAGIRCVTLSLWRDRAYRHGISASDEPRARQLAFQRASETLLAAKQVAVWEPFTWMVNG
ncbi:MAG: AAA family ATPase [Methylocella sp.]